jgi:glycerate dehydrogenase
MKIVFLDARTMNPGDLDFSPLATMGDFTAYDRTKPEQAAERAGDAEIIIVNKFPVNETTLSAMPSVKYICVAATGYNNIDIPAVRSRGIQVSNVRDYSTDSVAQHVFASILAWYNRIERYDSLVKAGQWSAQDDFCFYTETIFPLRGKTLGIAGYGAIGKKVAGIGLAFGMDIIVCNRSQIAPEAGIRQVSKEECLRQSDILTLHMPLTEDTRHWIDKKALHLMKQGSLLINTARGPLVSLDDLLAVLNTGVIGGAILDVLDAEPPKDPHPVIFHERCIVTPHIAWAGLEARQKLLEGIRANISAYLNGQWIHPVFSW